VQELDSFPLCGARPFHTTPSCLYIYLKLTFLHLGLPSRLIPSAFPTNNLYVFLFSLICTTFPAHLILDLIILIILGEVHKSRSFFLCSFLHPLVTSSLFGPNIFLSTLFPNSFRLCYSLNVRDQVSHTNRATGKIKVLCIFQLT
jgi:hypothetical protein